MVPLKSRDSSQRYVGLGIDIFYGKIEDGGENWLYGEGIRNPIAYS